MISKISRYASTPPLEAMSLVFSYAAATETHAEEAEPRQAMVNDISRAYLYAVAKRRVRLHVCLYGTGDVARVWQHILTTHLESIDVGKICTLVHGDDYMSSGTRSELDWLEEQLNKRYKAKMQRLRHEPGKNDINTLKIIIRVEKKRGTRDGGGPQAFRVDRRADDAVGRRQGDQQGSHHTRHGY